jgi:hypothetical protein
MEHLQRTAALSILLGTESTAQYNVRLLLSFHLRYFLAPSKHFLRKELSQIFVSIPGGGHTSSRVEPFMLINAQQ